MKKLVDIEIGPNELADLFSAMEVGEKVRFFNRLGVIYHATVDWGDLVSEMRAVSESREPYLSDYAREVMKAIGGGTKPFLEARDLVEKLDQNLVLLKQWVNRINREKR